MLEFHKRWGRAAWYEDLPKALRVRWLEETEFERREPSAKLVADVDFALRLNGGHSEGAANDH